MALGEQYGVSPSTYPGHQESNRNEPGYAPNPEHLNRGIDWSGSTENLQRFAEALAQAAPGMPGLEQIIWENPNTGGRVGLGGAGNPTTGYFPDTGKGSYAEHRDHVHTRFSQAPGGPVSAAYPGDVQGMDPSSYMPGGMSGDPTRDKQIREARESVDDKAQAIADAQARIDEMNNNGTATARERANAERDLAKAKREHADAVTDLNTAINKTPDKKKGGGDSGVQQLGQDLFSGVLQGMGLDGSVFSNPFDWPNVKSGMALANWGGGLLKNAMGGDGTDSGGGPSIGGLNLPGFNLFGGLNPTGPSGAPLGTPASGVGTGQAPGPAVVVQGNVGMDPRAFTQRVDAAQNQAYRRNMTAVRPGG
jgi:hypothetical protein